MKGFSGDGRFGIITGMNHISWTTVLLLVISNTVMSFAWYGHLRSMGNAPLWKVIIISWALAFFEYCAMIPANRIGAKTMSLPELKITQEAISLLVFVPFAVFVMKSPLSWNYLMASLCILGAVYFIFRS